MSVDEYLQTRDGERPLGVYALYDAHNAVQYVGYSRNMVLAVKVCFHHQLPGISHAAILLACLPL